METTRLSSKGQVIIPKTIRTAHRWKAGVRFAIEDTGDGVLLRPIAVFPETRVEEVIGCTGYGGQKRAIRDMDAAVAKGARENRS